MLKRILPTLVLTLFTFCHSFNAVSSASLDDIMNGRCTVIDLTYPLNSSNAYWPGPSYSPFKYEIVATLENNGVFSGIYFTPEHLGTHIDAPNHFKNNHISVDKLKLETLIGPAAVIDISTKAAGNADYQLTVEDITLWEKSNGLIQNGSIVLLNTGWWKKWNDYDKYKNADEHNKLHFPGYSKDAAIFLTEKRNIKGIGIDTLSADYGISSDFIVHHIINGKGKYILENVANLDKLPPNGAILVIAPIKIEGGSGGQARIWAILPLQQSLTLTRSNNIMRVVDRKRVLPEVTIGLDKEETITLATILNKSEIEKDFCLELLSQIGVVLKDDDFREEKE